MGAKTINLTVAFLFFFGGNLLKRRVGHYQAMNAAEFCAGLRDIHRSLSPLIFEKNPPNIPGSKIKISVDAMPSSVVMVPFAFRA